jgi:ABC-type multidrug transport system permease subunit
LLKALGALILGALISFVGVVLHNSIHPFGILLALLTTAVGISFTGQLFGARKFKIIAATAWLLVALRAGSYGLSQELLIISNLYGNAFLLGGFLIAIFTALKKV